MARHQIGPQIKLRITKATLDSIRARTKNVAAWIRDAIEQRLHQPPNTQHAQQDDTTFGFND